MLCILYQGHDPGRPHDSRSEFFQFSDGDRTLIPGHFTLIVRFSKLAVPTKPDPARNRPEFRISKEPESRKVGNFRSIRPRVGTPQKNHERNPGYEAGKQATFLGVRTRVGASQKTIKGPRVRGPKNSPNFGEPRGTKKGTGRPGPRKPGRRKKPSKDRRT